MDPQPLTGRCLCGAVRFEAKPPTTFAGHCHCESCRRAHSAAFVTWTAVPKDAFALKNPDERLTTHPSSPGVRRSFCGVCGTPLVYTWDIEPNLVYIPVATLETPLYRRVQRHFSYEEHASWLEGIEGLPCVVGKGREAMDWAGPQATAASGLYGHNLACPGQLPKGSEVREQDCDGVTD